MPAEGVLRIKPVDAQRSSQDGALPPSRDHRGTLELSAMPSGPGQPTPSPSLGQIASVRQLLLSSEKQKTPRQRLGDGDAAPSP